MYVDHSVWKIYAVVRSMLNHVLRIFFYFHSERDEQQPQFCSVQNQNSVCVCVYIVYTVWHCVPWLCICSFLFSCVNSDKWIYMNFDRKATYFRIMG